MHKPDIVDYFRDRVTWWRSIDESPLVNEVIEDIKVDTGTDEEVITRFCSAFTERFGRDVGEFFSNQEKWMNRE